MKKITALLLVICMIFMLIPIHTSAAIYAVGECGDGVYWSLDGNGILTIYGKGAMSNNYCRVQPPWLAYRNDINTVIIKSGVTYIDDSAFYNFDNLTHVVMADTVTGLGKSVFDSCENLSSIVLSSKLTTIGAYAFRGVPIESFTIPEGITTISEGMFSTCLNLKSVTFKGPIKDIGNKAFIYCSQLESLESLHFEKGVTGKIGDEAFAHIESFTEIEIPDGITYIGENAFYKCKNLTSAIMPEDLFTLRPYAFSQTALTSITLPKSVYYLPENTFIFCDDLKEITMYTETVERLSGGFSSLRPRYIHIIGDAPQTDIRIVENPVKNFVIYYDEGTSGWEPPLWQGYLIEIWGQEFSTKTGTCGENLTWELSDGVLTISGTGTMENYYPGNYSPWEIFKYRVKKIIIEEGVESIGNNAFVEFEVLESVTIPSSVKRIGNGSFEKCIKLKEVIIPEGVETIGGSAFENCSALTRVSMTDNVTLLGSFCFSECRNLEEVRLSESLTEIPSSLFYHCYRLKSVNIPSQITKIGSYAFEACSDFMELKLPDTLVAIDNNAFYRSGVKEITIPAGVTSINFQVFYNCKNLQFVRFLGDAPKISNSAFENTTVWCIYPSNNDTWTEVIQKNYSGTVTWITDDHVHAYEEVVVEATCTEPGSRSQRCSSCAYTIVEETFEAFGHDMASATCAAPATCQRENCGYQEGEALNHTWAKSCEPTRICTVCGYSDENGGHSWNNPASSLRYCSVCDTVEGGYYLDVSDIEGEIWLDGKAISMSDVAKGYLLFKNPDAKTLVTYTYAGAESEDPHKKYPTGMKVWRLTVEGDRYKATYIEEFDNLLQYAGSSIRITGTKGIRMITSIEKAKKEALTGEGLAGYTLVEYGTVLCLDKDRRTIDPLILGQDYVKSNYAYKKDVADPIFAQTKDLVQYTNVLVGFNNRQYAENISMRPYIILEDAEGTQITIYGGIVVRTIGYIAYQNRNAFQPRTNSYHYVWEIIRTVYGGLYNGEYWG